MESCSYIVICASDLILLTAAENILKDSPLGTSSVTLSNYSKIG